MSIDALAALLPLGAPQATKSTGPADSRPSAVDQAQARADAAKLRQKQDLDEVREKGLYQWAQERKFEKLKEKIEAEIKAARGLSDDDVAAMSTEDRTSFESEITRRIQEVMQESLTEEAKKSAKEGRPAQPMIIDISV